jgi:hypothetical protein
MRFLSLLFKNVGILSAILTGQVLFTDLAHAGLFDERLTKDTRPLQPIQAVKWTLEFSKKSDVTSIENLSLYKERYPDQQLVHSQAVEAMRQSRDLLKKANGRVISLSLSGPAYNRKITPLNKQEWFERLLDQDVTVRIRDTGELIGTIPVRCYDERNCIGELVIGFCGILVK